MMKAIGFDIPRLFRIAIAVGLVGSSLQMANSEYVKMGTDIISGISEMICVIITFFSCWLSGALKFVVLKLLIYGNLDVVP